MAEGAIGVIIVAGGSGRRMGSALPKQFLMLHNRPVLAHTIDRMHEALPAARIVVVLPEEHIPLWRNLAARFDIARHEVTAGGSERFHSVANGLAALGDGVRLIAVHDGVRPLASKKLILRALLEAKKSGAAIPVVAPADSYRIIDGETSHPIDRSRLRIVQTPQVFDAALLREAYRQPFSAAFTDDASVVEAAGHAVTLCEGERENIKITTPSDLDMAEAILNARDDEA